MTWASHNLGEVLCCPVIPCSCGEKKKNKYYDFSLVMSIISSRLARNFMRMRNLAAERFSLILKANRIIYLLILRILVTQLKTSLN